MLTEQMPYYKNKSSWGWIGVDKIILTSRVEFLVRNQAQPPRSCKPFKALHLALLYALLR